MVCMRAPDAKEPACLELAGFDLGKEFPAYWTKEANANWGVSPFPGANHVSRRAVNHTFNQRIAPLLEPCLKSLGAAFPPAHQSNHEKGGPEHRHRAR